jgi:hypothetical protein
VRRVASVRNIAYKNKTIVGEKVQHYFSAICDTFCEGKAYMSSFKSSEMCN